MTALRENTVECEPFSGQGRRTDEELFLQYRSTGDRHAFAQLVNRYERELYNYLRRYLDDAAMAEDVFQATFLLVHLKSRQFETGRPFRPWLYAIAIHAAIDAQRRDRRHRAISLDRSDTRRLGGREAAKLADTLVSPVPGPYQELHRCENGQWVHRAVGQLSEQMRSVVHLVYYQGLKYREAAEVLDVPVGTVKSRLNAAVQKLSEFWSQSHRD